MRKILLGTTAVVGTALLGATAHAQTAPTVRVGGYFEFTAGYISDSIDSAPTVNAAGAVVGPQQGVVVGAVGAGLPGARPARGVSRDKVDFRSDLEIVISVAGKAANGLEYGAEIELQMDNVTNSGGAGNGGVVDTDEAWLFVRSPALGTLQIGDQDSAADQLKVAGSGPLGAITGFGYSAQWDEFIAANSDGTRYLLTTINDGSDATKIIYLSPSFFGFDFGISYAPNGFEGENFVTPTGTALQRDRTSIRNEIAGGVRYRGSFGNIGVAASFGAMRADAQENNGVVFNGAVSGLQDVTQYEIGGLITGFGFGLNAFYNWGNFGGTTRTPIRSGLDTSTNYGVGVTYTLGALGIGALYGQSERDNGAFLAAGGGSAASTNPSDRKQTVISVGAVYTLAPGLQLFANYTNIDDKNIANSTSNPTAFAATGRSRDIDVFVIGTRLTF